MPTLFEALGNIADLPGSLVRDAIALENPLDQFLTPLSSENRTRGSQLLEKLGLGPDHDALGFGVDILTDPLTWFGFGAPMLKTGIQGALAGTKASKLPGLARSLFKGPQAAREAWEGLRGVGKKAARGGKRTAATAPVETVVVNAQPEVALAGGTPEMFTSSVVAQPSFATESAIAIGNAPQVESQLVRAMAGKSRLPLSEIEFRHQFGRRPMPGEISGSMVDVGEQMLPPSVMSTPSDVLSSAMAAAEPVVDDVGSAVANAASRTARQRSRGFGRQYMVERLARALSNPNARKIAGGGGLLQLQSLGRESGMPMADFGDLDGGFGSGYEIDEGQLLRALGAPMPSRNLPTPVSY